MNTDFWMNKRVLVTGHNGFKGSWLCKWLDSMGAIVLGISLEPEKNSGIHGITFSNRFQEIAGDVRRKETFAGLKEFAPEIVFHMAAQAIVKTAKEFPTDTFETNVMGTVRLLEALRECPSVRAVVVITSDKVYENLETGQAYCETDPLFGSEVYSNSKVCQEMVAKAYYESYLKPAQVGLATARACNVYGGGDYHFDRLIPYLEQCAYEGKKPEIRNRDAVRPWQYVLDILRGYLMLAEALYRDAASFSGAFNFGPDRDQLFTVGQMADLICEKSVSISSQEFFESSLLLLDSSKSRELLGWKPYYGIKDGLRETALAYESYFKEGNTNELYEKRIRNYQEAAM